ncbi:hypothetical protein [Maricaulis sp.]|uniref:hypothetical protein n=1 Tax=Maricaulis sp. TaxID=1486257 RepID=UPI002B2758EF|nr:hypothetical protein [Maricaulis sp.]
MVELASYLTVMILVCGLYAGLYGRHRADRSRRHPGYRFVEAFPILVSVGFLLLNSVLLNVVIGPAGVKSQEGFAAGLAILALGFLLTGALLYLTRSEIRWSDDILAARRWPGADIQLAWNDIRQAGISEIFMRVWVTDAQGRTRVIGKATRTSRLADKMAARLGDRFIGIRKPQPVAAE